MYNVSDFNLGSGNSPRYITDYCSHALCSWQFLTFFSYYSHGDFVTIIDLPEGEHQYKFFVDGEWRHDPGVVCICNKIKQEHIEMSFCYRLLHSVVYFSSVHC
jgi:hypothetical protein